MSLVKHGYFKPGKDYHYSNTNYVILGKVAEAVEGQAAPQAAAPALLQAAGPRAHGLPAGPEAARRRRPRPLELRRRLHRPHARCSSTCPSWPRPAWPTRPGPSPPRPRTSSIWADALYGGKVLSAESLEQMTTFLRPGLYGLGTDVALFAGNRAHGHRGGIRGYESSMWYFPESGVSVVLLSNQGNWITDVPMEKLVKAVLGCGLSRPIS